MSIDVANWQFQKDFLNSDGGDHNEFILLGDSRAMAGYDPLIVDKVRSRNLALGGSTSLENYYTLKKYLEKNTTESIILSFAPYHLVNLDTFWKRAVKFGYLTPSDAREIFRLDTESSDPHFDYLRYPMLRYYQDYFPFSYRSEIRQSIFKNRYKTNKSLYDKSAHHRGLQFVGKKERSEELTKETKYESITPLSIIDTYFQLIAELAAENDISLFWYTAPLNTPSCDALSQGFQDTFNAYLDDISERFSITILNRIICMDPNYFADRGHLNRSGTTVNSKVLVDSWRSAIEARIE